MGSDNTGRPEVFILAAILSVDRADFTRTKIDGS